jgi:hypothetical protein
MPQQHKTWIFVSQQNARLDELMALFDCRNEIAPFDIDAFGQRAGKLIAASSSYRPKPQLQNSATRRLKIGH